MWLLLWLRPQFLWYTAYSILLEPHIIWTLSQLLANEQILAIFVAAKCALLGIVHHTTVSQGWDTVVSAVYLHGADHREYCKSKSTFVSGPTLNPCALPVTSIVYCIRICCIIACLCPMNWLCHGSVKPWDGLSDLKEESQQLKSSRSWLTLKLLTSR